MRLFVVVAALVLGVTAHAQQGANTERPDPTTMGRVRVDGAAGGTGAKARPEASGGGTVGRGRQNRHSAPEPPDTQQPLAEKPSERNEAQAAPGADTVPADPATLARVRVEGAAGGTGAKVPPEASGGGTVGRGRQNRHSAPTPPDTQQTPPEKRSD